MAKVGKKSTETTFERELARLNPAQRAAVDQIDGPVMVLAGPGTGKTHLLSARIGNILQQTDTPPGSILCLTYTEAGVKAMRERLLQWIGPEAYRVAIHTFHGFCSQVIRDHLEYFGRSDLEPLSDLERVRVIREILDDLDPHHPLRAGRSNAYFFERQLSRLFAAMKSENWTSAGLQVAAKEYLDNLSDYPDFTYRRNYRNFKKGDLKTAKAKDERIRMERLQAAAALFPFFDQKLAELSRYDYDDMIRWVLQAFNEHEHLMRLYQERYLYVLVDEFQDTNGSQDEIVRMLAAYWERPNLFIVGDDDQSIYEFQGARLRSMLDFYERYENVRIITLRENYRSNQRLLDAAAHLIDQNEHRISKLIEVFEIEKHLLAASEMPGVLPRVREYRQVDQELLGLMDQIHSWRKAGREYGEIAIIYARHQQAEPIKQLFEREGIPYQTRRRPNVLDSLIVRQLRELLVYFDQEDRLPSSGEHMLFRLLHFACFGIPASDLARLAIARRKANVIEQAETWRDYLAQAELWPSSLRAPDRLRKVAEWLESMQAELHNLPLVRFIDKVLQGSGMLAHHTRSADKLARLLEIRTFLNFAERESLRKPRIHLRKFLSTLSGMDANRIELPLMALAENSQAVQLLTAHSAKGLEFACVWMYDCVEKQWGQGRSANNQRFKLPPTLTYSGEEDLLEAKRRLFYVAMTRAKSELVMSYASQNAQGKPTQAVQFLATFDADMIDAEKVQTKANNELTRFLSTGIRTDEVVVAPPVDEALIDELLKDMRLSVSALHTWLDCPLAFYYERVLQVPRIQRPAAVYGEALHEALQNYFLSAKKQAGHGLPSKGELVFMFELSLARRRAWLEPKDYEEFVKRGKRELSAYFDQERQNWTIDVQVEKYIGHVEIDGVPVTAVIDRIDEKRDGRVDIVDYKTGFANKRHTKPPGKSQLAGGTYWRQLVFYKMVYEAFERGLVKVDTCTLSYLTIGPDGDQAQVSIEVKPEDEEALRIIIHEAYARIMAQDFYQGCGEDSCLWCNFVRDRQAEVPAVAEELELLDDNS
ncbi:MAG: ATP-dependent DNA helicase [Bacteroidota bacterium]